MDINIQNTIKDIAIQVNNLGGKMYFVGGYVRDLYLGKEPSDVDVRVVGITKEQFNSILEQFGRTCWIDARYEIVKIIDIGEIDFASPENKDGSVKTIDDVTRNVDFAMNSIAVDVVTGEVIDKFGGIEDIKNRIIRIADIDSLEDEFLAVRACRFKAKLGFEFDNKSEEEMKNFTFKDVKKARVFPELRKLMNDDLAVQSRFYSSALNLGILYKLFSPLDRLSGLVVCDGGIQVDAFEHTMRMINYLMRFKNKIFDFEEFYMVCLTYHFRSLDADKFKVTDDFREFFDSVIVTNKIRNTVYFFQDNEKELFETYNNFEDMTDEELATIYRKYRLRLEYSGYVIESYRMGFLENLTQEQIEESINRTKCWDEKIKQVRELSKITIKKSKTKKKKHLKQTISKSPKDGYTLGDLDELTSDVSLKEVEQHFNRVVYNRRRKNSGRNR